MEETSKNNIGKRKVISVLALVLIIAVIIMVPLAVNNFLLKPAPRPVVGTNVDWLTFWGSYLAALVSALIAFLILFIQRRDNHIENKRNRQLQINVLKYQQEMQWLNENREILVDLAFAVNVNDLRNIQNDMAQSKDVRAQIKELMDRITYCDMRIGCMHKDVKSEAFKDFTTVYKQVYHKYSDTLYNLQTLYMLFIHARPEQRGAAFDLYKEARKINSQLQNLIERFSSDQEFLSQDVFVLALPIVTVADDLMEIIRNASMIYIKSEEQRIRKIVES